MPRISEHIAQATEAMSVRYNNLVYDLQRQGHDITVLSLGEAFFDLPPTDLAGLPHPSGLHYSHSRGLPELRVRLARYYLERYGVDVDPESELLLTAGSKAAIYFAMMAVLNPGDEVLIPEPSWVSYPEQARLCFAKPVAIPLHTEVSAFDKYLTPATRMLVINNPNNPSGYVYSRRELAYLVDLARSNDIFLLADEAYSDFLLDDGFHSVGSLDADKTHTIVCNSISKNIGISGWRIGYAISNPNMIGQLLKINQHVITCPPTNLQQHLVRHFDTLLALTEPQIRRVVAKRRTVADHAERIGLKCMPGSAGFYLFLSIAPSTLDSETFALRLLREHHICVVPGIGYGASCDDYIRISVGSEPMERIHDALDCIGNLIKETRRGS